MVDNTGNWSAPFTNEIAALVHIFNNLSVNADGTAKFRVGVMFATETGGGDSNINGGYMRAAIRPMTTANKALYSAMFVRWTRTRTKATPVLPVSSMAEAYRYFVGGAPYAGNNKNKTDYTGNDGARVGQSQLHARQPGGRARRSST